MKLITLVISSDDVPQYKEMRELATLYHRKMQGEYEYRFFFVEFKEDLVSGVEEKGDFIYVKGREHFFGMYDKIMSAIQFIHHKYEYDYIDYTLPFKIRFNKLTFITVIGYTIMISIF
jgi:hypothetical protein